jgi:hypothetical protein
MASRQDQGQVILLAGILLVLAFILFSVQVAVLANLGQQVGRETENPLLEDYLLVRRSLESSLQQELRNATTGKFDCPHLMDYGQRVRSQLELLTGLESNRGQAFRWSGLGVGHTAGFSMKVEAQLYLSDGFTTVTDILVYSVVCDNGAVTTAGCPPALPTYAALCRVY